MRAAKRAALAGVVLAAFLGGIFLGGAARGHAAGQTTELSHYKCYPVGNGTDPTHVVRLTDQFGTERTAVGPARVLCTPVTKTIVSGPAPRTATGNHFVCYTIAGRIQPPPVNTRNQLGPQDQAVLGPGRLLCVPSAKRVASSPPPA